VALSGGYDTRILAFRLGRAPAELSGRLVLRLLRERHDPARVLKEKAVHDALQRLAYSAPAVFLAETDTSHLGGAFLIMERIPGAPLPEKQKFNIGGVVARLQAQLHALSPAHLLNNSEGWPFSVDWHRRRLAEQVDSDLEGLRGAMEWLLRHIPPDEEPEVICHGDFHPYNILTDGSQVTSVIDWPNAVVGPAVFDVATTLTILRYTQPANPTLALRLASLARPLLVRRYLGSYGRLSGTDLGHLAYYEALACMRGLVLEGQRRLSGERIDEASPWNAGGLIRRVREITGITASLPA